MESSYWQESKHIASDEPIFQDDGPIGDTPFNPQTPLQSPWEGGGNMTPGDFPNTPYDAATTPKYPGFDSTRSPIPGAFVHSGTPNAYNTP